MKKIMLFFIFNVLLSEAITADIGICTIDDNNALHLDQAALYENDITDVDGFSESFPYTGDLNVYMSESSESNANSYIDVSCNDGFFTMKTNDNFFKNLEEDNKNTSAAPQLILRATPVFTCGSSEKAFLILLKVSDVNTHKPEFSSSSYTYKLTSPIQPHIDLTSAAGSPVFVTDLDFSVTNIEFQVSGHSAFEMEAVKDTSRQSQRDYRGVLKVNQYTILTKTIALTVTATDNGVPPLTSDAVTINIELDEDNSLPSTPSFSQPIYRFHYSIEDGLTTVDGSEIVLKAADPDSVVVMLTDENNDEVPYFRPVYNKLTGVITVESTGVDPERAPDPILILTLTVILNSDLSPRSIQEKSETIVIIRLPPELVIAAPKFLKPYYTATYNPNTNPHSLELTDDIQVTENATVSLEGDTTHFSVDNVGDVWILKLIQNLDDSVIEAGGDSILTLHAIVNAAEGNNPLDGYATLVVILPYKKVPKFTQSLYTATYRTDAKGNAAVVLDNGETIIADGEGVVVQIASAEPADGTDYFELAENGGEWSVKIKKSLTQEVLNSGEEYVLALEATVPGSKEIDPGYSTLVVKVPVQVPVFGESYYAAEYMHGTDAKDSVSVINGPITIQAQGDITPSIKPSDFSDNFELVLDKAAYAVNVKKNLEGKVLLATSNIVLTLQATVEGVTGVGEATLIIEIPNGGTPLAFSEDIYYAEYSDGINPQVKTDKDIEFSDNIYALTVTVELIAPSEFQDNFKVGEGSPYSIIVNKPLDEITLEAGRDILLTLTASLDTATLATAVVVVKLPEVSKSPRFSSPTYTANYVKGADNNYEVELKEQIKTDAEDPSAVSIIVKKPYDENFKVSYDNGEYKIAVLKNLDLDTIDDPVVYVTLTTDASRNPDVATLAVKLPEKTGQIVPKFSEIIYFAQYNVNKTVTNYQPPIIITSGNAYETVVTVTEPYSAYFEAQLDDKSWILNVVKPVDDIDDPEIYVGLEAILSGSIGRGAATVVVRLPDSPLIPAPKFSQPRYSATYSIDEDTEEYTITEADPIGIISSREVEVLVTLRSYTENFELTRDDAAREWILTKVKDLDQDVVKANTNLVIELQAHLSGSQGDSFAVLVVNLPKGVVSFGAIYYEATYETADDVHKVAMKDNSSITVSEGVKNVLVSGDYSEYFKVSCDTQCTLSVARNLAKEILTSSTEILLVLTATRGDQSATATVIIGLPLQEKAKAPEFTQNTYTGSYEDGEITLEGDVSIGIQGDVTDVDIAIDESSKVGDQPATDYFKIDRVNDQWHVTSIKPLPFDVLTQESAVLLKLKATKSGFATYGEAGLILKLPKEQISKSFHFKETTYLADYETNNNSSQVTLSQGIEIKGEVNGVTVAVTGDYSNYFRATLDANGAVNFESEGILASNVLDSESAIAISLEASKGQETDRTIVVIRLPKKTSATSIYFKEPSYMAHYNVEDDKFELNKDVELVNDVNSAAQITLEGDYEDHFKVVYDTEGVKIQLTKPLPEDVTLTYLDVVATLDEETASTKLIITTPVTSTPDTFAFEDSVYMANYELEKASPAISLEKAIKLVGKLNNIRITLSGDYKEYFAYYFDSSKGEIHISLKNDLGANIIESEVAVTINVVAFKDSESHQAVVIVKLPKKTSKTLLNFEKVVYIIDYTVENGSGTITSEDNIILLGDSEASATITLTGLTDYFEVTRDENKPDQIVVSLKTNNLPDTILYKEAVLSGDVVATTDDETTKTKLLVKLPLKVVPTSFYFDQASYRADYIEKGDGVNLTLSQLITINGEADDVTVALEDKQDYFDVTYNYDYTVTVTSTKPLESSDLEKAVMSVNLVATRGEEQAKAVLVVQLPKSRGVSSDKDSIDQTGLIAAVAVLAVLLVMSIIGSVIFFRLKLKRRKERVTEESSPKSFIRNSHMNDAGNRFKRPSRRATGISLNENIDIVDKDDSFAEPIDYTNFAEKRKSVQFDTDNIDETKVEKPLHDSEDYRTNSQSADIDGPKITRV